MALDGYKNLAIATVATAPTPPTTGTSLVVSPGMGARLPTPPFNATVWPAATLADPTNAEIVRVTAVAGDTLTIARSAEPGPAGARSITVGDFVAATFTAKWIADLADAGNLLTGTVPDARLSANVALLNAANIFTQSQAISVSAGPRLLFTDTSQATDAKNFRINNASQLLTLTAINDAQSTNLAAPLQLDRLGNAKVGADIYEKGRATPLGHWADIPFSGGDFSTPTGGATWVVTSAAAWAYTLLGKTAILSLTILNTGTITGAPVRLRVQLPAALTGLARPTQAVSFSYGVGATVGTGVCSFNGTQLDFIRDTTGTTFPAGTTYIYLSFPFSLT